MKPKALKKGDTIGLIAPASPVLESKAKACIEWVKSSGYNVKWGESIFASRGYLSGDDELRANDINMMFRDEEVDAIFCIRGGYGTMRLLDMIDYDLIKNNPKIFIGYSDITALHTTFYQRTGLITFHGPMVASFAKKRLDKLSEDYMMRALMNPEPLGDIINPPDIPIRAYNGGCAKGKIVGGNLSILADTMGTPYEIDTKDKILFIEDVGERPYNIDRMLLQLKLGGKFRDAAGIVIGDWADCVPEENEESLTIDEIIEDIVVPCGKPILSGYKIGHCSPNITIPIGAQGFIDCENMKFSITESAVV
ncbi:S66 peptidase family protein [Lutispora thermophila]|uniref:Muramoyltetrapeptide carboxypeptidase n=1 Tax=Lutispora thermophila DSM 19022 TaxID=1122184 RepID=A0A1M6B0C1_9FIRM|nr:LD-carboxypeptidase [Lutispora thermophila]SHI42018.1 muramoyltetrapeptide carboxypeptidase [Lutispora thermophila DSM 19022]